MRLIDADALLEAYDREHVGPPGRARKLIEEAPDAIVKCKDCKYRSFYCTEATDGTTLYECHHPCANSVPRPGYWFCADGERREQK